MMRRPPPIAILSNMMSHSCPSPSFPVDSRLRTQFEFPAAGAGHTDNRVCASRCRSEPDGSVASPAAAVLDSHPSDQSLIESHLLPWAAASSGSRKAEFIHEADPYTTGPDVLARMYPPAVAQGGGGVVAWYFLARLRRKSENDGRVKRTVEGGGSWHGETRPRPVFQALEGSRQVGWRQGFSFQKRKGVRTGWIMSEFRLYDDPESEDVPVLCKVYRSSCKPSYSRKPKAPPHGTESEGETNGDACSAATGTAHEDEELSWSAASGHTEKKAAAGNADSAEALAARKMKRVVADGTSGAARKRKPGLNSDNQFNMPSDPSYSTEVSQDKDSVYRRKGWMQLKAAREELRVRRQEALAKMVEQENMIMFMDVSKLDDTQRAYVEAMRAQILASKKGGGSAGRGGENGSV